MLNNVLHYETIEDNRLAGDFRVEAIDTQGDGEVYIAIFSGPEAKERAEEYAEWKNSVAHPKLSMAS
jgi:hypothetical protein